MTELRSLQRRFLDYLQHANPTIESDIAAGNDSEATRRLSIYYNAYRARLREGIDTDHPVLGAYLGDDRFETMVSRFIDAHPSAETSLRYFCDQLPGFLRNDPELSRFPVLAEIAAFERVLMEVYDAANAKRRSFDELSAMEAAMWPGLTLSFHPSIRIYVSEWNSVEIWQAIKSKREPPSAVKSEKRAWLLWRNVARLSEFRSLQVDEYNILNAAMNAASFATLCDTLLEWHLEDAVAERALELLQHWFSAGLVTVDANN